MKNNVKTQDVGQRLVDPQEKLRRESAERKKEQSKSDNAKPKIATVIDKSISEKSDWESKTEGSNPLNNHHLGETLVHEHAKDSSSEVPGRSEFESDINHIPAERSSGRKLRKTK